MKIKTTGASSTERTKDKKSSASGNNIENGQHQAWSACLIPYPMESLYEVSAPLSASHH